MPVTRRPTSTTDSTTCEPTRPLRLLLVVASLSGNTRELARMIACHGRQAGHAVHWQEAEQGCASPPLQVDEADLLVLGCWTDNAGRTPAEMKAWIARMVESGKRPRQVAVFGTGETQWGVDYYCGAVHRLIRYFDSQHPALTMEQMPQRTHDATRVAQWMDTVLGGLRSARHADH